MAQGLNYFIFNKAQDYRRGYMERMEYGEDGLRPTEAGHERSLFLSRILDSREEQMNWHRLTLEYGGSGEVPVRISIYASDEREVLWRGKRVALKELVEDQDSPVESRREMMASCLQKTVDQAADILLHEVVGRYLWILLEMYGQEENGGINRIRISFPRQSWMQQLPEIYRKAEGKKMFLERYLALFQTMYEDLNDQIAESAMLFDMESTQKRYLEQLARWLDIRQCYVWPEEKLRLLLRRALSLYQRRGTRQGLLDFIALYTGEAPFCIEFFQLEDYARDRVYYDRLRELYGNRRGQVCILVREGAAPTAKQYKILMKLIDEMKPAQADVKLTVLKPYIFLNGHSYLGVNSVLGRYQAAALNGRSMVPFLSLGEGI